MEILITTVGILTMLNFLNLKKESFEPTYFDSEEYYRQNVSSKERKKVNTFNPSEQATNMQTSYNNKYDLKSWTPSEFVSPIANNQILKESQENFILFY